KLVGIPLASTLLAFIYNPSVLEEAGVEPPQNGWTWDDFKSICLTVKETTGKYGFGGSAFIDTNLLNYWVRQYGVPLFAADNKSLGFDDQQILTDYFQLWKDLIDAGAAPNPDEYEQIATLGNEASPVITGDAAFTSPGTTSPTSAPTPATTPLNYWCPRSKRPARPPCGTNPVCFSRWPRPARSRRSAPNSSTGWSTATRPTTSSWASAAP